MKGPEEAKMDCIFCQIATGQIPSDRLYQDDDIIAFPDVNPKAPTHLLIIPRRHIPSLAYLSEAETALVGQMTRVANQLAREAGLAQRGYRLVINCGPEGGQAVPHLHMHLLGGRQMAGALG